MTTPDNEKVIQADTAPLEVPISPEMYRATLAGLTLESISCVGGMFFCDRDNLDPPKTVVETKTNAGAVQDGGRYVVHIHYQLEGTQGEIKTLIIDANYRLDFSSSVEVPADFFDVYHSLTLPTTTLPYFREFVTNSCGRMGVPVITLPYQILPPEEAEDVEEPASE